MQGASNRPTESTAEGQTLGVEAMPLLHISSGTKHHAATVRHIVGSSPEKRIEEERAPIAA